MMDHARDLASVCEATDRLLTAVADLDDAAVTEPSRLPGWTRGHVLAHLARNADALVNVLEGRPMYVSGDARDADIERDAPRPLKTQLADVRDSAHRFQDAASVSQDWSRTVELRNGVLDTAAWLPFRRWIEVELHHVDLGIGYELEDLPEEFTQREINFLAHRFHGRPEVPALMIRRDDGRMIPTGAVEGVTEEQLDSGYRPPLPDLVVSGSRADLLGWLAGRRDGTALRVEGGTLPSLPPL
ncbi:maleylpyruvate isomerase family mycothiol-dependent enzyme [Streptomyces sp. DSM 3412]|uniref:Maleylpyruvate isomerase family mycothiol-dependent enzyme n=1 Tax=Streptomyces gottesmaniae TaxID=3075518 RepID=A0ABU2YY38_9ACTN|nr:maleylpyruvate isomerase family mycothiol-dependent enzyme [Streptomyces sp. DSM 3412]MDT0569244.1 maleylpyruvate isomerase family mycothiol-dependent enzyme [Streptomyces sp. DSM 3412]